MGQIRLMGIVSQRLLKRLRGDIFAHVQRLDLGYLARQGTGDLMSRLVNDIDTIGTLFSQSLTQALGSIFSLVGVIIAMFALDWRLSIATLLILPVMFGVTFYFSRQAREIYRLTRRTPFGSGTTRRAFQQLRRRTRKRAGSASLCSHGAQYSAF